MKRKPHTEKEILKKLHCADLMISEGKSVLQAIRAIGISMATYYRWRRLEIDPIDQNKAVSSQPPRP
ncbi:MAG: hypothetical protein WBA88_26690 [Pseudaminobacter sp.]